MLRTITFLTMLLASAVSAEAQLKIFHDGDTEDLSGQTIHVNEFFSPDYMNLELFVTNEGSDVLELRARRTEVSVLPTTEHGVCWVVCPFPDLVAGAEPVYIVTVSGNEMVETLQPNDTVTSFAMHYVTNGVQGSSEFLIEFIDPEDNVVGEFTIVYSTPVGLEEQLASAEISLAPNPAGESVRLTIENLNTTLDMKVFDLLGQTVMTKQINTGTSNALNIDTSSLKNGIYFVSLGDGGKDFRTLKLVVRH